MSGNLYNDSRIYIYPCKFYLEVWIFSQENVDCPTLFGQLHPDDPES